MSATPKCPCGRTRQYCVNCPVPAPTPALDRLDFETTFNALMVANGYDKQNAEWLTSAVLPYLNAQVAEIVRVAREEEREKHKGAYNDMQAFYDGMVKAQNENRALATLVAAWTEWQVTLNKDERSLEHTIAKGKLAALDLGGAE